MSRALPADKPPADKPPGSDRAEPVFDLRSVRRRSSADWIADRDVLDDETIASVPRRPRTRQIVVRVVGYVLLGLLFWGMARLIARRPIRAAIVDWTTMGLTEQVRSAQKRLLGWLHR